MGELNPYGSDPKFALFPHPRTASGNRLREIVGLTDVAYLKFLTRVNLCSGKWSADQARVSARSLRDEGDHEVIVLLGAKVCSAFGGPPTFQIERGLDARFVTLPHPSGLCRAWNEEGSVDRARAVLTSAAPWVPWGMTSAREELTTGGVA